MHEIRDWACLLLWQHNYRKRKSLSLCVTTVNHTKTAELIEVSFGYGFRFDLGGARSLQRKGQCFFRGGGYLPTDCKVYWVSGM